MTPTDFQSWLNTKGANLVVDGRFGPASRAAIPKIFASTCADSTDDADIAKFASRLGCTPKQLKAVSFVESGGSGYDKQGRPKILFERHLFHRFTNGKWSPSPYSSATAGGYATVNGIDSWEKLGQAAAKSPYKAFEAVSWGKFQVLGMWWDELGYSSPIEMAYSTVASEDAHYEMLIRYIEMNEMQGAVKALSTDASTNRAFAKGYNGPAYTKFNYHVKLAKAMA